MKKRWLSLLLALSLVLSGCVIEIQVPQPMEEGLTIHFIDVGQADCALLECGGFTKFADKNKTVIVRRENGVETRIAVKAEELSKGKDLSQNALLQRGDYIIANESFF